MKVLLIIDIQNDFCPGGALAVKDGDRIISVVNSLSEKFDHVILTQDWHIEGHSSFASVHLNSKPYDIIQMSYGSQVLWPEHCVIGTKGANFHPDLNTNKARLIIRKGFRKEIDSYSAFFENDHLTTTGLTGYLKNAGIDTLYLVGIATDFCVKYSAIDSIKEGFTTFVIEDAVKGIDINGSVATAWSEMKQAGVKPIHSSEI